MSVVLPSDPRSPLPRSRWLVRLGCAFATVGMASATVGPPPGDCCVRHSGIGCDNQVCEAVVCAIDSFCCTVAWDSICAGEADEFVECGCRTGLVGCGETQHSCFASGQPGCENAACCENVCGVDPSCCATMWDFECVLLAVELCPDLMQPNLGISDLQACVLPDGSLQIAWNNQYLPKWSFPKQLGAVPVVATIHGDSTAMSREFSIVYLPAEGFNAECQTHEPGACGNGQCSPWLATIASDRPLELIALPATCLPSPGGCMCGITDFPMVIKVAILSGQMPVVVSVAVDPSNDIEELDESDNTMTVLVTPADACPTGACCLPDGSCVEDMTRYDCAIVHHGQFRGDGVACAEVTNPCLIEGACMLDHDVLAGCLVANEATCIALGGRYLGDATSCPSNCCIPHGSLDCDDTACMDLVCIVDCFCCSVVWDQICADEAAEKCAVCTPDPVGAPVNNDCSGAIEVMDGTTAFSTLNANGAGPSHPGGCVIGADIWFKYHSTTPGPVSVSLCGSDFNTMLAIYDNDQCNLSDDTLIACNNDACGTASQLTFLAGECAKAFLIRVGGWNSDAGAGGVLQITTASDCVPGDVNHDGAVNGADIAVVLGSWGPCNGCPADTNYNGVVDGTDLAIVLGNWTG